MFRKERVLLTLAVAMSVVSPIGNSFQSDASIASVVVRDIHVAFKEWRVPTPGSHPHVLSQRAMERSGTPDRWPTCSAVLILRPGSFGNSV